MTSFTSHQRGAVSMLVKTTKYLDNFQSITFRRREGRQRLGASHREKHKSCYKLHWWPEVKKSIYIKRTTMSRHFHLFRNYHDDRLSYYNFNVAWWRKYVGDSEVWTWQVTPLSFISLFQEGLAKFLSPCISFIEAELAMGRSVLVHCLAGAHRSLLTQSTAKIWVDLILFTEQEQRGLYAWCTLLV